MKKFRNRAIAGAIAVGGVLVGSVHAQTPVMPADAEQACADPDQSVSLFAKKLRNGRIGYGITPETVRIPGPTLELVEGQCMAITLTNDTDRRLSFHPHGVDYTVASDGTPLNDSCVKPGKTRTYIISTHPPMTRADGTIDSGSAGYWHYHDHCMGTPHGTKGIYSGLFGALIVRRAGDPVPDHKPVVLTMIGMTFNLKTAPRTPTPTVDLGDRVEFVVIGHGDLFHTFHLHGHRWVDNRTGFPTSASDGARTIDNKTVGPADSFGFQIVAGEHVGPGAWMYHCHVQGHSDAGMSGLLIVRDQEGQLDRRTLKALQAWEEHGDHGGHPR